jgi:hypothetical protein
MCSRESVSLPVGPWARKGLVAILRIAARPCNPDCSGNPATIREAVCEELERKARFFAPGIAPQAQGQKMRTDFFYPPAASLYSFIFFTRILLFRSRL